MKPFEIVYIFMKPALPALYRHVNYLLSVAVHDYKLAHGDLPIILDVGGRGSPYTIGINAEVTISELRRESEIQYLLNLGIDDSIVRQTMRRRSNIKSIVYDDMVYTELLPESYDIVVAVEVLEHVDEDELFVQNVAGRLRPGGIFIMTTPNGDYRIEVRNPDHKRHYRRAELEVLLTQHFPEVNVYYAVKSNRFRHWGVQSWSLTKPAITLKKIAGNLINRYQSARSHVASEPMGTHHLIAVARKQG